MSSAAAAMPLPAAMPRAALLLGLAGLLGGLGGPNNMGAEAINSCGQFASCHACVAQAFCGWCSPGNVIYSNGSNGTRCGDERDEPWDCPQHYSTESCGVGSGYACNTTTGKCDPKIGASFVCSLARVPPRRRQERWVALAGRAPGGGGRAGCAAAGG
eukprot:SAG22_NODE_6280_length_875_cov_1.471649_2_plen_157_part_01